MTPTVVLVGNPNTGKSSLFNGLTGSKQRVGNWPGVTVEVVQGKLMGHESIQVIDLPGVYALAATSPDEKAAIDYTLSGRPDLLINVVDASNLERNLYLTTQLLEAGLKCLVVLNMMDLVERHGKKIDIVELEESLGVPVVSVIAHDTRCLELLRQKIVDLVAIQEVAPPLRVASLYSNPTSGQVNPAKRTPFKIPYSEELNRVLESWEKRLEGPSRNERLSRRWLALSLLEGDPSFEAVLQGNEDLVRLRNEDARRLKEKFGVDVDVIAAEDRFRFIENLVKRVTVVHRVHVSVSEKVDRLVLHRFWGYPIFFGILYAAFSITMVLGGAFIDFFDQLFGLLFVEIPGLLLSTVSAPAWVHSILIHGLGVGIQTVATFIPIVFFMFLTLAILEDSGYLSRAAFLMDRLMRSLGLPGKAFVPLILGFGCTVPAIMATRTLENQRDRLLTVFMAPLMSCGARLPVYALFVAAFFPNAGGAVVFSLYLVGMVFSVATGLLLRKSVFKGKVSPFVMEISPYHLPRLKHLLILTWRNLKGFLFKAGYVIIIMVSILGVLNTIHTDGSWGAESDAPTLLYSAGQAVQPIFAPMGVEADNWPAAVSLFTGLFAKEAVVGTLTSLYQQADFGAGEGELADSSSTPEEEESPPFDFGAALVSIFQNLGENLRGVWEGLTDPLGLRVIEESKQEDRTVLGSIMAGFGHNPWRAYAYLLFVLLYIPCVAALSAMFKETGPVWTFISGIYLATLSWCVATLFYQLAHGYHLFWIIVPLIILAAMVAIFFLAGRNWEKIDSVPFYAVPKRMTRKVP